MELTKSKKLSPLFTGERKCQLNEHSNYLALSMLVGVEIPSKHLLFLSFQGHQKITIGIILQILLMVLSTLHSDQIT
ncbi:hypothetical protein RDI58_003277 [Solanum bulbocastanum]|uniref:Uncharacterized protein n=1 Tax=Solanum bulbocastanum TaxID=147425 RepID=A0AAN8U5J8_SOLBU